MSTGPQASPIEAVMEDALKQAGEALGVMAGRTIRLEGGGLENHPLAQLQGLLGDPDQPVIAAFLEVRGDMAGLMLLLFPFYSMSMLVPMLLGPIEATEELINSAVGEVGNVVGSSFLNALADRSGLRLFPSPPQVVRDMAGALLGSAAAAVDSGASSIPLIRTRFEGRGRHLTGYLVWLPGSEQLHLLERRIPGGLA